MTYIRRHTALLAILATTGIMGCMTATGSSDEATGMNEEIVEEASSALTRAPIYAGPNVFVRRVFLRFTPNANGPVAMAVQVGAMVSLVCHTRGDYVNGNNLWYKLDNGYYVPDAAVWTGTNYPVEAPCVD
ncbi:MULTISPECIES: hypothetical protein [Sorangium]|uniref:SH3b domain-containing protein n=1 Tax=Sorangium atrum TaxID=2995308 RepID=A0ABT5C718_9BACT|nr:hypothetical protein [Sorangium aterium]MDC0681458.1 hypothetical protein [Sorangium aterium]